MHSSQRYSAYFMQRWRPVRSGCLMQRGTSSTRYTSTVMPVRNRAFFPPRPEPSIAKASGPVQWPV